MDSISSPPQQIQQASTWGSKSFFPYWCLHRQPARSQLTAYNEGMLYCEMWRQNLQRCFSSQLLTMTHPRLNWMGRRGVILTSNVPTLQDICMQNSHWLSVSNFDRHGSYRITPPRFKGSRLGFEPEVPGEHWNGHSGRPVPALLQTPPAGSAHQPVERALPLLSRASILCLTSSWTAGNSPQMPAMGKPKQLVLQKKSKRQWMCATQW